MKSAYPLITLLLLVFSQLAYSQIIEECGTYVTPEQIEYMRSFENINAASISTDTNVYVPVSYFIARRTDSTGGLNPDVIPRLTNELNDAYRTAGVQFYSCGDIHFIDSTEVFNFERGEEFSLCGQLDVQGTMNVYFFNSVKNSSGNGLCGYAYFPGGPGRIIMNNSCALNGSTFIHEVGHFFSLYHTHGKTNSGTTDELVDGSNCEFAGDNICDTPADPNLNGKVSRSCKYTGSAKDANGDDFVPDPNNIMSYSRKACRNYLSPGQLARVNFSARFQRPFTEPCCSDTFDIETVFSPNVCEGDSSGFIKITKANGYGQISYSWSVSGDSSVLENLAAGEYIAYAEDQIGCVNADTIRIEEIKFPDTALPDTLFRLCSRDTIKYPLIELPDSMWTAVWLDDSGIVGTPDSLAGNVMPEGSYQFQLADSLNECYSVQTVDVIDSLIDLEPAVDFSLSNFRLDLFDSSPPFQDERRWVLDGSYYGSDESLSLLLTDTGWLDYCLVTENICGSESFCDSIYIEGFRIELLEISPLCHNGTGNIELAILGDSIAYDIFWIDENGFIGKDLEDLRPGKYAINVIDEYGSIVSDSVELSEPQPITFETLSLQHSTGNDGMIEIRASGGTPPYTYLWNNGENSSVINGLAPGDYECTVVDDNSCMFSTGPITVKSVSFSGQKDLDMEWNVFPVPVSREFTINVTAYYTVKQLSYSVFDFTGREIEQGNLTELIPGQETQVLMDCRSWPSGSYFIVLNTEKGTDYRKIIKQ